MRFDREGMKANPEIPFAKSMPDYICAGSPSSSSRERRDLPGELGIS